MKIMFRNPVHVTQVKRKPIIPVAILTALAISVSNSGANPVFAQQDNEIWVMQDSGSKASLRGICAVNESVCWASGSAGTVLKTVDKGKSWESVGPPECEEMDFRDIQAWDELTAVIMSAGDPDRIYRTNDGGKSWNVVFEHPDASAFLDGMAFHKDGEQGWVMGDPVDGHLTLAQTKDSGKTWNLKPAEPSLKLPDGVAGFAASGTNLTIDSAGSVYIGLGGKGFKNGRASIFILGNGVVPISAETSLPASEAAGIFSVVVTGKNEKRIVVVGGDYTKPDAFEGTCSTSDTSLITWDSPTEKPLSGYRSAIIEATIDGQKTLIATGPNGTDRSDDFGKTWQRISDTGFHTASFVAETNVGWAAGSEGRIAAWKKTD